MTKKEFDFGIIKTLGGDVPSRRMIILDFLKENNFTVNIIEGWDQDRDQELAKCKTYWYSFSIFLSNSKLYSCRKCCSYIGIEQTQKSRKTSKRAFRTIWS